MDRAATGIQGRRLWSSTSKWIDWGRVKQSTLWPHGKHWDIYRTNGYTEDPLRYVWVKPIYSAIYRGLAELSFSPPPSFCVQKVKVVPWHSWSGVRCSRPYLSRGQLFSFWWDPLSSVLGLSKPSKESDTRCSSWSTGGCTLHHTSIGPASVHTFVFECCCCNH